MKRSPDSFLRLRLATRLSQEMPNLFPRGALLATIALLVFACSSSSTSAAPAESCTPAVGCPGAEARSYSACTSNDGMHCSLKTSDKNVIDCNGCADCASAAMQAASWCAGTALDGGSAAHTTTDGGNKPSPDATCALLLQCLSTSVPMAFPAALAAYGPDGSCWQSSSTAQTCHAACQATLDQYEKSGQCGPGMPGLDSGTPTSPTWTYLFATYLAPGKAGGCGQGSCHSTMTTPAGAYAYLQGKGYISGTSSPLIDPSQSCLSWFGGNMPPSASTPPPGAVTDFNAWAAAGAHDN